MYIYASEALKQNLRYIHRPSCCDLKSRFYRYYAHDRLGQHHDGLGAHIRSHKRMFAIASASRFEV
jgi:hypothetical protein